MPLQVIVHLQCNILPKSVKQLRQSLAGFMHHIYLCDSLNINQILSILTVLFAQLGLTLRDKE